MYPDIYRSIDKSGLKSIKMARNQWNKNIIDKFFLFSYHNNSNVPNLSNPNVNLSLASQNKCDNMFSDPESDNIFSHFLGTYLVYIFFFSYVVIIHLLRKGEGIRI